MPPHEETSMIAFDVQKRQDDAGGHSWDTGVSEGAAVNLLDDNRNSLI